MVNSSNPIFARSSEVKCSNSVGATAMSRLRSSARIFRLCCSMSKASPLPIQTLRLADFLGHSANAVRWQIWTALLVYVLLRFLAFTHGWHHSFTRIFTMIRSALWRRWDLTSLLNCYGTASGGFPIHSHPATALFQGVLNIPVGQPHT